MKQKRIAHLRVKFSRLLETAVHGFVDGVTDFSLRLDETLEGTSLFLLSTLGCEISPVVSAPVDTPGARYSDCDRAAEDYCEHKIQASDREMDACVAEHRYKCLSSSKRPARVPRS